MIMTRREFYEKALIEPLSDKMQLGTVLQIGHPANNIAWIKLPTGWVNNHGRSIERDDLFDTLEHGAFELLIGGVA